MSRSPRLLLSQSFYHIMTRGNNRNIVFKYDDDYHYYLDLIKKYKSDHSFDLYHYTLMSNHTHFLIKTKSALDFATFMKKLNLAYFYYYKQHYGWIGHFWQGRYKSKPVGKDSYFIQAGKYIELNPVRKNIVKKSEDYHFSSFRYYGLGEKNDLITPDFIYQSLGKNKIERQNSYRKLIIDEMVVKSYNRSVWGSASQAKNEQNKIDYHKTTRRNQGTR
ncbi:MAG: putative transposase [Candidatus Berkelbacteria bacterium Licking1014_7]|uniref:Putative transposase n=1 Tax=Candidatus Berkelbacteria bacterium Licking1014_7 TaxID=2017147 RepID=A0A554LI96_9BACT|nr:MAG: putative transposase [Candidatus Berkelbacteria bacterium Licking1014_7]